MTWYLTIRSDSEYSRFTPTAPLLEWLKEIPDIVQTDRMSFVGAAGMPWLHVVITNCNRDGNYTIVDKNDFLPSVNLVELICSYNFDRSWYHSLASRIAAFLGWEAVDLHGEDGLTYAGRTDPGLGDGEG